MTNCRHRGEPSRAGGVALRSRGAHIAVTVAAVVGLLVLAGCTSNETTGGTVAPGGKTWLV